MDDKLEELQSAVEGLNKRVDDISRDFDERWSEEKQRYILSRSGLSTCSSYTIRQERRADANIGTSRRDWFEGRLGGV